MPVHEGQSTTLPAMVQTTSTASWPVRRLCGPDNPQRTPLEGYFSIFKRGMKGIYQHCAEKHLHRYVAEFDFRYNHRVKLGSNDAARTEAALRGIVCKRLTYQQSIDAI